MSVAPFPIDGVIARVDSLKDKIKLVGEAGGLVAALAQQPNAAPAVFITSAEIGRAPQYTGPQVIQKCDVTLRCVLFVQNVRGQASGAGAAAEMRGVIEELRRILFGWTPDDAFDALHFQAGRDESFKAGWLCNQQVFGTNYRMQQVTA